MASCIYKRCTSNCDDFIYKRLLLNILQSYTVNYFWGKGVMKYSNIKKFMDVSLSLIGLIVLFPLLMILALMIKIDSKGPVLFKQKRVGKNKKYFYILKFRTMRVDTPVDVPTHLLKDPKKYITKAGGYLRKLSLDELPQIWNILMGHMSIVGPRPALWNQYDLIEERDKYGANDIRPGLTGWAQINGRDELPIEIKAGLDGEYVRKSSFGMDIRCIVGTVVCVLSRKGIKEGNSEKTLDDNMEKQINLVDAATIIE